MDGIDAIRGVQPIDTATRTHRAGPVTRSEKTGDGNGFGQALDASIEDVTRLEERGDRAVLGLASGQIEDVHQVMIAMNEADLAFRMMLEVRNRIVDAYKEISHLQM